MRIMLRFVVLLISIFITTEISAQTSSIPPYFMYWYTKPLSQPWLESQVNAKNAEKAAIAAKNQATMRIQAATIAKNMLLAVTYSIFYDVLNTISCFDSAAVGWDTAADFAELSGGLAGEASEVYTNQ